MKKPLATTVLTLCLLAGLSLPLAGQALVDVNQDGQLSWIVDTGDGPLPPELMAEVQRAIARLALLTGYTFTEFDLDTESVAGEQPELTLDLSDQLGEEELGADIYEAAVLQLGEALGLDQPTIGAALEGVVGSGSESDGVDGMTFSPPTDEERFGAPIPLPPSLGLLALALAGLGLVRRNTRDSR